MDTNTGILFPEQISVGGIVNPSGDWSNYLPTPETQASQDHLVDTMACVSYSATHCIESQVKLLTGSTINYSERFLAKMSGTTLQGNWLTTVADTIKRFGMVLDTDWPEPVNFTWDSYYAEIPQSIIDKGQEFLKQYSVISGSVDPQYIGEALSVSPLQVVITKDNPHHAVELINQTEYFDTYAPYVKQLDTAHSYFSIIIKPKMQTLTEKEVLQLQNLEGYNDPNGAAYWTGKTLDEYLQARLPDKIKQLQANL